jgi:hypothetical protein
MKGGNADGFCTPSSSDTATTCIVSHGADGIKSIDITNSAATSTWYDFPVMRFFIAAANNETYKFSISLSVLA